MYGMKRVARIVTRVVAAVAVAIILLAWDSSGWRPFPSVFGQHDARRDISRGLYKELGYGLPFAGSDEYAYLLRERYGIEFYYVGSCTVSESLRDYSDSYNKVSVEAAERKYGRDVFKEAYEEAQGNWKLAHPI